MDHVIQPGTYGDNQTSLANKHESEWSLKQPGYPISSFPLSFAQQRLWMIDRLTPGQPLYNIPIAMRIEGLLNPSLLEKSVNHIIERHDVLRTTFAEVDGHPFQRIAPSLTILLRFTEIQEDVAAEHREYQAHQLLMQEAYLPFDLSRGPLIRTLLIRVTPILHFFLVTVHHSVFDGWSASIFMHELTTCYEAFSTGRESSLPPLSKQYVDYAIWQRTWLQGKHLEELLSYWKKQLSGIPPLLRLPTDIPRPAVSKFQGARYAFKFPAELTKNLYALCQQKKVTLFMVLLATFQVLLYRYSDQQDLVIGVPTAGRMHGDVEELIGFFVNTLVIRNSIAGDLTFSEHLEHVRMTVLEALMHQELPFERLVEEMQLGRAMNYNPLFQVLFVLQNTPARRTNLADVNISYLELERVTAKFDLSLEMQENADGLQGIFEYSTDLFKQETIARLCNHFQVLLEAIMAHPDYRIGELPLLTKQEKKQILVDWNTTQAAYPRDRCIHQLFEEQADKMPDAIALRYEDQHLSYREVNQKANQLARYLQSCGVEAEALVGICLERSLLMIIGILAILKAGGAYVPLDPTYPPERLAFMLEDTQIFLLLTQQHLENLLPSTKAHVICLDTNHHQFTEENYNNLPLTVTAQNLAYVIYTSGSTGQPKGVCITHQNVTRLVKGTTYVDWSRENVFLQLAPISFDASTFEIWGSLLHGGQLVIFPAYTPSLEELGHAIEHYHITVLWLTAGLFNQMVEHQLEKLIKVRYLLAGGDILSATHVQRVLEAGGNVINGYGPTEGTTFACCYQVSPQQKIVNSIPIGRPIENTQVYVLNTYLQPVPVGVAGELYIGGDGLAREYLHRPELTQERFIKNPFITDHHARLYKTGDVVRYRADGTIEFLGRNDNQVKIRGFRIELGEIEAVLQQHSAVIDAVVLPKIDQHEEKQLVAYIRKKPEAVVSKEDIQHYLQTKLPSYMLPSSVVLLEAFPLTANGKVDRRSLASTVLDRDEQERVMIAPRNTIEVQIANIFVSVLGINNISVTDDFFLLGGHSLSAMRALSRLQKSFGQTLSLSTFFQGATVEQLARCLTSNQGTIHTSPIVSIQPEGTRPPFYCVHSAGGDVFCYVELASELGKDQPLYAFEESFLSKDWQPCMDVRQIATKYIQFLREQQPRGPYFLGGYSFGGSIAFEMACQLQQQGEEIALLALFDAAAPSSFPSDFLENEDDTRIITWFTETLLNRCSKDLYLPKMLSETELRQIPMEEQWEYLLSVARAVNYISGEDASSLLQRRFQIYRNHVHATKTYLPETVSSGKITVFCVDRMPEGRQGEANYTSGWAALSAQPLDVYHVPGDHFTLLDKPYVQILAERLKYCLHKAQC
jgi:amino acid adenylation domain-containing protein